MASRMSVVCRPFKYIKGLICPYDIEAELQSTKSLMYAHLADLIFTSLCNHRHIYSTLASHELMLYPYMSTSTRVVLDYPATVV